MINLSFNQWLALFKQFLTNWRQFLLVHVAVNVVVFVILAPLATVLLNFSVGLSGEAALSDQEIIFFLMSPCGLLSMLITASVFSIILFLEHAVLLIVGYYSAYGRPINGPRLLALLASKAASLFGLSLRILLRILLTLVPFLLLLGAIYYFLLGEFDINFYLSEKPPEFYQAVVAAALLGAGLIYTLSRLFISWVFCLPFLLINGLSPAQAMKASREAVAGKRIRIGLWLLSWLALSLLFSALFTGLLGLMGTYLVPLAGDSFGILLLVLGALALLGAAVTFVLTWCGSSLLSLLILHLFRDLHVDYRSDAAFAADGSRRLDRHLSWRKLAWASVVAVFLAALFVNKLLDQVHMEDRTEIMAHRGASGRAPENTLAAIQAAIEDGADWVEIDVQETADGAVVVIHDRDLKKIAGEAMTVADSKLADLQQVDIGSWFGPQFSDQRILTLKQVLEWCKGKIGVNIELKYYGRERRLEESVAEIVEAAGMQDQVLLMSLSYAAIRKIRQLRPEWKVGLLSTVALGNISGLELDFLALNARLASGARVRSIQNQEKQLMVWTVNDAVGMSVMFGRGVDAIITDEPALAVSVLEQRTELNPAERLLMHLADVFDRPSLYREQ